MILHVLNASPSSAAFRDCLGLLRPGDSIVLMGDGVYASLMDTVARAALLDTGAGIYMLIADAAAAGVMHTAGSFKLLDMDGFVALTEIFPRQQCWY